MPFPNHEASNESQSQFLKYSSIIPSSLPSQLPWLSVSITMAPSACITALLATILAGHLMAVDVDTFLSPLMSPLSDDVCREVECGKGKCRPSSNTTLPFSCECDQGWRRVPSDDDPNLSFLPCVIPNCTLNYSCTEQPVPRFEKKINPANLTLSNPCNWAYCGGGQCNKTTEFKHACQCNRGYYNLMNSSSLPCFSECSVGMDCGRFGIAISNKSAPATPSGGDGVCKGVECGKGKCRPASGQTGFSCECDDGWRQVYSGEGSNFAFLPCVVPNCTLDYSCTEPTPRFEMDFNRTNSSILNPCHWAYCGGGDCSRTSILGHTCKCNSGYYNLLNATSMPCFSECSIGADCTHLGITLRNNSAALSPGLAEGSEAGSALRRQGFLWVLLLGLPMAMVF